MCDEFTLSTSAKQANLCFGAGDGTWTHTVLRPQNFKSCAATKLRHPGSAANDSIKRPWYWVVVMVEYFARPGGEVVTQRSAKPPCTGSIPVPASKLSGARAQPMFLKLWAAEELIVITSVEFFEFSRKFVKESAPERTITAFIF